MEKQLQTCEKYIKICLLRHEGLRILEINVLCSSHKVLQNMGSYCFVGECRFAFDVERAAHVPHQLPRAHSAGAGEPDMRSARAKRPMLSDGHFRRLSHRHDYGKIWQDLASVDGWCRGQLLTKSSTLTHLRPKSAAG